MVGGPSTRDRWGSALNEPQAKGPGVSLPRIPTPRPLRYSTYPFNVTEHLGLDQPSLVHGRDDCPLSLPSTRRERDGSDD